MGNSGAFQTMIKKAPTDERRKFSTPRPTGHTLRDLYRKSPVVAGHLHELLAFSASHFPKEKIMRKTWVCAALLAAMVGSTIAAANAAAPVEEPIVACDLASLDLGSVEILPLDLDALPSLPMRLAGFAPVALPAGVAIAAFQHRTLYRNLVTPGPDEWPVSTSAARAGVHREIRSTG